MTMFIHVNYLVIVKNYSLNTFIEKLLNIDEEPTYQE